MPKDFVLVKYVDQDEYEIVPGHSIIGGKVVSGGSITYRHINGLLFSRKVVIAGSKSACNNHLKIIGKDVTELAWDTLDTLPKRSKGTILKDNIDESIIPKGEKIKRLSVKVEPISPKSKKVDNKRSAIPAKRTGLIPKYGGLAPRSRSPSPLSPGRGSPSPIHSPSPHRPTHNPRPPLISRPPPSTSISSSASVQPAVLSSNEFDSLISRLDQQDSILQRIVSTMMTNPDGGYIGPKFVSDVDVSRLSRLNRSELQFSRILFDMVELPTEAGLRVQERDSQRNDFVYECLRKFKEPNPNKTPMMWKNCVRKYNYNLKRRAGRIVDHTDPDSDPVM